MAPQGRECLVPTTMGKFIMGVAPHFQPYQQQGNTGASGMYDRRKISPGGVRTSHSSSSSSAMLRDRVPGARAGVVRWIETMPLSKA